MQILSQIVEIQTKLMNTFLKKNIS